MLRLLEEEAKEPTLGSSVVTETVALAQRCRSPTLEEEVAYIACFCG
jgi:hypothetical protein